MTDVRQALEEALRMVEAPAGDDDTPLELSSLQVVMLTEEIERAFDVRLGAREVTRENFATRRALRALLGSLTTTKAGT